MALGDGRSTIASDGLALIHRGGFVRATRLRVAPHERARE
jgi:hypothetical protein